MTPRGTSSVDDADKQCPLPPTYSFEPVVFYSVLRGLSFARATLIFNFSPSPPLLPLESIFTHLSPPIINFQFNRLLFCYASLRFVILSFVCLLVFFVFSFFITASMEHPEIVREGGANFEIHHQNIEI